MSVENSPNQVQELSSNNDSSNRSEGLLFETQQFRVEDDDQIEMDSENSFEIDIDSDNSYEMDMSSDNGDDIELVDINLEIKKLQDQFDALQECARNILISEKSGPKIKTRGYFTSPFQTGSQNIIESQLGGFRDLNIRDNISSDNLLNKDEKNNRNHTPLQNVYLDLLKFQDEFTALEQRAQRKFESERSRQRIRNRDDLNSSLQNGSQGQLQSQNVVDMIDINSIPFFRNANYISFGPNRLSNEPLQEPLQYLSHKRSDSNEIYREEFDLQVLRIRLKAMDGALQYHLKDRLPLQTEVRAV